MTARPHDRLLGLSPRARRLVFPLFALALIVILVGTVVTRGGEVSDEAAVGDDLHALGELSGRLFVGGHRGAGYRANQGEWTQIASLDDKDVMGWAQSDDSRAADYTSEGDLVVAALSDDRAQVYTSVSGSWKRLA